MRALRTLKDVSVFQFVKLPQAFGKVNADTIVIHIVIKEARMSDGRNSFTIPALSSQLIKLTHFMISD